MELTLTITIDDKILKGCAEAAAVALFRAPDGWRDKGAAGYLLIAQQVEAEILKLDLTTLAKDTAQKFARGIVEDVTREQIRRMAKEVVKAAREDGSLL